MSPGTQAKLNRMKGAAPEIDILALRPFLKWPGGKRWAAYRIADLVRTHLKGRYYEPFVGGAAVFFHVRPHKATLSDINADLIDTYRAVRNRHFQIIRLL